MYHANAHPKKARESIPDKVVVRKKGCYLPERGTFYNYNGVKFINRI